MYFRNPSDIKARLQGTCASRHTSELIDREQDVTLTTTSQTRLGKHIAFLRYLEENAKEIFWMSLYTLVLLAIFTERAYCKQI